MTVGDDTGMILLPSLKCGNAASEEAVEELEQQPYFGLTSCHNSVYNLKTVEYFYDNYDIVVLEAGKATKNMGNMILATRSVIGKLPPSPWEL